MKGKLVIISAPSGAGKSTIVNHLLSKESGLEFSISATTRAPRGKEKNGREYYFLSPDEFKERVKRGDFIEWEEVYHNQFYGTLKSEMERIWSKGKYVLFDVDVMGGIHLKNLFTKQAIAIFIMPPSLKVLERRLRNRGTDNEEEINRRLSKASEEMKLAEHFDKIVINDNLGKAQNEVFLLVKEFISTGLLT